MKAYRFIVGLALLPRALRVAGSMLVVLGVLVWVVLPATCSALVSSTPTPANDAPSLERQIEQGTAELVTWPGNTRSRENAEKPGTSASSGNTHAEPICFQSDVVKLCCPSACAARDSSKWPKANEVLRGCARGIGCKGVDGWTVGMKCDCGKGK